jgi:hypothetical protein
LSKAELGVNRPQFPKHLTTAFGRFLPISTGSCGRRLPGGHAVPC